jgi:protease I
MTNQLKGSRVAVLAVDGFEQAELVESKRALAKQGATVHVISSRTGKIQGCKHAGKGDARVDKPDDLPAFNKTLIAQLSRKAA